MAYYLPSSSSPSPDPRTLRVTPAIGPALSDLKVFWGPDICRLEYLVHLLDTGRIKDEFWQDTLRVFP